MIFVLYSGTEGHPVRRARKSRMSQAYQHNPSSEPKGSQATPKKSTNGPSSDRINELALLSSSQRELHQFNTQRLQSLIENFCEQVSGSVVASITKLAAKPKISNGEVVDCYVHSRAIYTRLSTAFQDGMWFYRQCSPKYVDVYYKQLTLELDECLNQLSNVVTVDSLEFGEQLRQIAARMRAALSMDTASISLSIREDLEVLRTLSSNNPEVP